MTTEKDQVGARAGLVLLGVALVSPSRTGCSWSLSISHAGRASAARTQGPRACWWAGRRCLRLGR